MNDEFKLAIKDCFSKGIDVSTDKMSAAEVVKVLKEKFPGLYRIPAETTVATTISALFTAQKRARENNNQTSQQNQTSKLLSVKVWDEIRSMMNQYPGKTTSNFHK